MAIEAYIYDYGARHLSDTFMKRYVDKLDLTSKWAVVPRLVAGQAFPTDGQGFEALGRLVSDRNALVHHKSRAIDLDAVEPGAGSDDLSSVRAATTNAVAALDLLSRDIRSLDPDEGPAAFLCEDDASAE